MVLPLIYYVRFGRIVYQKKIHEGQFDVGTFVQFAVKNKAFQGAAFIPE